MPYDNRKIRALREARGWTLEKLATQCGLTRSYLSRVERSSKAPPVSTLTAISHALAVELQELLTGPPAATPWSRNLDVVRRRDLTARTLQKTSGGYLYQSLMGTLKNKWMAPFLMVVPKDKTAAFTHDAEEFAYVLSGTVQLFYEGRSLTLERGDSVYFDARRPHAFAAAGCQQAMLLTVNLPYRRF